MIDGVGCCMSFFFMIEACSEFSVASGHFISIFLFPVFYL